MKDELKDSFHKQIGLKFKEETSKVLRLLRGPSPQKSPTLKA
jgi:hypothetical protein